MAINTIDFSNWPDWNSLVWQAHIYSSLSRIRDAKVQRELTSIEKEILEALEKRGAKPFTLPRGCINF
jgi:hypothetical protein